MGPALFYRAKTLATGQHHMVAVRADGTLWVWGRNQEGQLGINSTTSSSVPVRVGLASTWASAAAGYSHTAGEQSCWVVWAWGFNMYGEVGDGTTPRLTPVQV